MTKPVGLPSKRPETDGFPAIGPNRQHAAPENRLSKVLPSPPFRLLSNLGECAAARIVTPKIALGF